MTAKPEPKIDPDGVPWCDCGCSQTEPGVLSVGCMLSDVEMHDRDENLCLPAVSEMAAEAKRLQVISDRPLDDDANVLIARCVEREPLSHADQRELWAWLEERGVTVADLESEIERLRKLDLCDGCFRNKNGSCEYGDPYHVRTPHCFYRHIGQKAAGGG